MSAVEGSEALQRAKDTAGALLGAFFAPPNVLRRQPTDNVTSDDQGLITTLQPSLRWYEMGRIDRPFLLPYREQDDGMTTWYACAPSDAVARALTAELQAFIGPSFADFGSAGGDFAAADANVSPLVKAAGWRAVRFRAFRREHESKILQQWATYWELQARRPETVVHAPKTFGQLRAAFDRALLARNEAAANDALATLRERHGLTAENRTFLEIRLAAAFGRWEVIESHRLLPALMSLQLPPETYGDVLESLYETHMRPFEETATLDALLKEFSQTLLPLAAPLFRTRGSSRRPAVLKSFLLHELVQLQPDGHLSAALLASLPPLAFGALDELIHNRVASLASGPGFAEAKAALDAELFDRAYGLLWSLRDDVEVLRALLRCAREAEDPSKASAVIQRLHAASDTTIEAVKGASPKTYERVLAMAGHSPVAFANWTEQVSFLSGRGESDENYVARWRELARSADPAALIAEAGFAAASASALFQLSIEHPSLFEQVFPLWHELFVERAAPDARLVPVYQALLETLRLRDVFGDAELTLLRDSLVCLITAGVDATEYRRAVEEMLAVFEDVRSPHVMTWALDLCDALAIAPCRDAPVRLRLLSAVAQAGVEFFDRLAPLQRSMLAMLATEAGVQLLMPEAQGDSNSAIPQDSIQCNLVLYSLDTEAARRASVLLRDLYPAVRVQSSADEVCTKRLQGLAQSADVFVFAWKSSKHQAYFCVKNAMRQELRLAMATGAGTTSLVQAATTALTALTPVPVAD